MDISQFTIDFCTDMHGIHLSTHPHSFHSQRRTPSRSCHTIALAPEIDLYFFHSFDSHKSFLLSSLAISEHANAYLTSQVNLR